MKRLIFLIMSTALLVFAASASAGGGSNVVGAAYTISNAASGNALVVYDRAADGSLAPAGSVSTGGVGTGGGLASQGAVTLTDHGNTVLAVNPGSNSVAAFAVRQSTRGSRLSSNPSGLRGVRTRRDPGVPALPDLVSMVRRGSTVRVRQRA